jgi:hypothetical protein
MAAYGDGTHHVRLKVLDCPISPGFSLDNFVSRSPQRNPDVPPAYYLISPCRLRMVEVVHHVVEFGDFGEANGSKSYTMIASYFSNALRLSSPQPSSWSSFDA